MSVLLVVLLVALVAAALCVSAVVAFRSGVRAGRRTTAPEASTVGADGVTDHTSTVDPQGPVVAGELLEQMRPAAVVINRGDDLLLANASARDAGLVSGGRLVVRDLLEISRLVREQGALTRDVALPRSLGRASGRTLGVEGLVLDDEGTVGLVVHDVTEARRLEEVRRDFVANVSHELKTPVGALMLLAEAVDDAADDPEAIHRFAGRMQHEGTRLARLVREIIELSRLQGGDPMPPLVDVSVAAVVREACDLTRLAADTKSISLVPSGERGLLVPAVEAQLVMALANLLTNAVAYSPPGTRVAVGYRRRGEYAEVCVTDEGIGIPSRDLARIFERFYRVDPARSSATGGTGLGLSIVKHVATNHNGSVEVWSVEGQGSTFTLRLPAVSGGPPAVEPAVEELDVVPEVTLSPPIDVDARVQSSR